VKSLISRATWIVALATSSLFAAPGNSKPKLVAVMPLQSRGVDSNSTRILEGTLTDGLMGTGKMRLMERAQMSQVLSEQGFQQSGACDQSECAVQIGKVLGVEQMLVGSVGLLGKTYVFNARLIDVGTGEVIRSSARKLTGQIDAVLSDLVPEMVADLSGSSMREASKGKESPKSGHAWMWWTAGGAVVAGGAAAAVLLYDAGGSEPKSVTPSSSTSSDGLLVVDWSTK